MKNGSNEILEAKVIERDERAKKLYRYVNDVARRIGDMTTASSTLTELFSMNIEVQRQKLRDNCEKLLFLDPLNYGKKSLELLWRKVYYDTISNAKKLRETDNKNDNYLYTHIECGIGNFHHFIDRLQSELNTQFKDIDYIHIKEYEDTNEKNGTASSEEIQFCQSVMHSCLIYLGDLSRYQVELFQTFDPSIAARYYLQAAHIDLSLGMPYNQLGNLYLDKNYNLDSVCYYIQCMNCASPFEGAVGNLTKIFEKNAQYFELLNESEIMTQTEHIQNMIINFLSLIEIWYLGKNDTNIPQRCNKLAHEFKICIDFNETALPDVNKNYTEYTHAKDEENINPSYLNTNIIHKIILICLFTIVKMNENDESKAFACKAFTLALFSQLLQKLLQQIEMMGLTNPAHTYDAGVPCNHKESENDSHVKQETVSELKTPIINGKIDKDEEILQENEILETNKMHNGEVKNNIKKSLTKRRRRRRQVSSESSEASDTDSESNVSDTNESCSDEEDLTDSSCQSDDNIQSDGTDLGSDNDGVNKQDDLKIDAKPIEPTIISNTVNGQSNPISECEINNDKQDSNNKSKELNVLKLQQFLQGYNFLPSIKLLLDWALLEKDLIKSCGSSGESLFQCIIDLLNIFTYNFTSKSMSDENCQIIKYAKRVGKKFNLEYKTIPLPEDINLRGTNICKFDKDAAEWQALQKYHLSIYEENIIRILHFIDFGNQIAKIIPKIRFNRTMKIFFLKKTVPPKLNSKMNHKKSREWHNSKKPNIESNEGGLLRRLGRLWLASQVRELEKSGHASVTPAYLALDTAALNKHLRRVKQLIRSRNFILLVPTVVLQELDNLKREQITARDAIRWLELQLRSGSRFLRAQRPGQSKPLPFLKYPRKAPQHVHNFIQILEFCNHFIGDKQMQGGNGDSENWPQGKSSPLLILLVGNEVGNDEEQYKDFSVKGAAEAAGISIEEINLFYTKWRQAAHKNGKR